MRRRRPRVHPRLRDSEARHRELVAVAADVAAQFLDADATEAAFVLRQAAALVEAAAPRDDLERLPTDDTPRPAAHRVHLPGGALAE